MAEDLGERTEEATPKRRQEARDEGNVAKSQDLASVVVLIAGTCGLWFATRHLLGEGSLVLESMLEWDTAVDPLNEEELWPTVRYVGAAAVRLAAPVMLIVWLAALLSHVLQIGWMFSPKSIQPKLSKLNPLEGFKRIFGLRGLVKVSLDAGKVAVVMLVAMITVHQHHEEILVLPYLSMLAALNSVGALMLDLALRVLAVLLVLAIIDFIWQKQRHAQDLKMTKQQVKDEMKQSDGDPEVKKRRMRMQQQIMMQRIGAAVPKADVIVTNPEHISIAIQYDPDSMHAPKVIAKGADFLALRIRQLAKQHGVPIIERKPLARALYKQVEVGQEVPPEYYKAVAEILAYVYRLSGKMAG